MTDEIIRLENCPFCDGHGSIEQEDLSMLQISSHPLLEETVDGWWRVICYFCGVIVSHPNKNTAIERWNNRPPKLQIRRYTSEEKRRQLAQEAS